MFGSKRSTDECYKSEQTFECCNICSCPSVLLLCVYVYMCFPACECVFVFVCEWMNVQTHNGSHAMCVNSSLYRCMCFELDNFVLHII